MLTFILSCTLPSYHAVLADFRFLVGGGVLIYNEVFLSDV